MVGLDVAAALRDALDVGQGAGVRVAVSPPGSEAVTVIVAVPWDAELIVTAEPETATEATARSDDDSRERHLSPNR